MANPKRCGGGGGGGGVNGEAHARCAIHRGTPQEKWRRTRDVAEDIAGNLKDAIKVLQDENGSVTPTGPPILQAVEAKRKAAVKKALNKLGRALNQVSTFELYTADLNEEMHALLKKLEVSERTQREVSEQKETSASKMQEQVEYCKGKMQETLDRLHSEEDLMANMLKELEAARLSADLARKEKLAIQEQLRLREAEHGNHTEGFRKLAASEETLRAENEKLKKKYLAILKEKEAINFSNEVALNNAALANVERYKEVVAKVTADNMVFLMKLKHSEAALSSAQGKLGELQKEMDNNRVQFLEEASSEIQEIVRSSLSKAESCEAKLQALQRQQGKIVEEWEEKLLVATEKLVQTTLSRDWLEKNLVEVTEKYKLLEDEKFKLLQRYESECQHRRHAEAESRALICTLRKTNEELAQVNSDLGAAIKETKVQKNCVLEKEKEIKKLVANLDNARSQLETQQAINAALMKKKEEVEWELMTVEAQRAKLHQSVHERLSKSYGRSPPLTSVM